MTIDEQKEKLDAITPKNEKISWKRKKKNVENLIAELEPLEGQIMQLMAEKTKIMDKITTTRIAMVAECIHPADFLVESADGMHMTCKFCERDIGLIE